VDRWLSGLELPTVHRLGSEYLSAGMCVSALVFWQVRGIILWTPPRSKSVTTAASPSTKCLKTEARGQDLSRLVLRLQADLVVMNGASYLNMTLTRQYWWPHTVPHCSSCLAKCLRTRAILAEGKTTAQTAGIQLITKLKRNMKPRLLPLVTVWCSATRHHWNHHRSIEEYFSDWAFASSFSSQLLCQCSDCYCHQPKKPSIALWPQFDLLPA